MAFVVKFKNKNRFQNACFEYVFAKIMAFLKIKGKKAPPSINIPKDIFKQAFISEKYSSLFLSVYKNHSIMIPPYFFLGQS